MRTVCRFGSLALSIVLAGCTVGGEDPVDPIEVISTHAAPPSATTSTPTTAETSGAPFADPPKAACGTTLLKTLTLREKLGQLLTVGVTGAADAREVVANHKVGGVFYGSWTDPAMLDPTAMADLRGAARPGLPPMVTVDEEGGRVSRLETIIGSAPSARVAAASMTVDEAYLAARERAEKIRNLGITVDLAPVVDVSGQGDDTVIGDRSYSDNPDTVIEYAGAFIRAFREVGVGTVLKHFPGHGSGSGDSHTGVVSTPPLEQLIASDLKPYAALIGSGSAVMLGHLDVPGLTEPGEPASISPAAIKLLREGTAYGARPFDGVVMTDDLSGMAAMTSRYSIGEAVERALTAGADVALWITTDAVPAVLDRLEDAVQAGRLLPAQIDVSVVRIARYKGVLTC